MHRGIWLGNLRERDHLRGLGRDGMIILKYVCGTNRTENIDWIHPAEVNSKWWAVVFKVR
jgi:hypothetical protein